MTDYRPPCTRNPDLWFSDHLIEINAAATICNTQCALTTACAQAAKDLDARWGVWGGLNAAERDRQRRRERDAALRRKLRGAA